MDSGYCQLRLANGEGGRLCDGERCMYWRVVGQMGIEAEESGCAIQFFQLLDGGEPIARWLLTVKERCESGSLSA